jgi:hypothetical protein
MKAYWTGIDEATRRLHCHSGGFYGLAAVYTPEFVRQCESHLSRAAEAAGKNPILAERVALHAAGFRNVVDYRDICAALARGNFTVARRTYDGMVKRIDGLSARRQANPEYGTAYLRRFLLRTIDGGLAATAEPNRVVAVLPDRWRLAYDDAEQGEARGYPTAEFDASRWREAATYSATLSSQGLRENTVLWYRTGFRVPEKHGPLTLLFTEVDGDVTVHVNGKKLEPSAVLPAKKSGKGGGPTVPRRAPFEVDLGPALRAGENVVAVRVDNRKISELFLGGILRPVVLVEKGTKAEK